MLTLRFEIPERFCYWMFPVKTSFFFSFSQLFICLFCPFGLLHNAQRKQEKWRLPILFACLIANWNRETCRNQGRRAISLAPQLDSRLIIEQRSSVNAQWSWPVIWKNIHWKIYRNQRTGICHYSLGFSPNNFNSSLLATLHSQSLRC